MSCFFCESYYHLSQNCDIFDSDESRKNIAESKNCCGFCLTNLCETDDPLNPCKNCSSKRKCYICFSKNHHTVYCPDRLNDSQFFIPAIDKVLLKRFMQIQHHEGQYSLACTSPEANKFSTLKPLAVLDSKSSFDRSMDCNYVISEFLNLASIRYLMKVKSVIFKWKYISIKDISISSTEFLKLLLPRIVYLKCDNVKVTSTPLKFCSIMERSPNLEVIILNKTNIQIDISWPDDIIKWKNRRNLRMLQIPLEVLNFSVDSLVALIKEKSKTDVHILLNVSKHFDGSKRNQNINDKLPKMLLTNFYPAKRCSGKPIVELYCPNRQISFVLFPSFSLE